MGDDWWYILWFELDRAPTNRFMYDILKDIAFFVYFCQNFYLNNSANWIFYRAVVTTGPTFWPGHSAWFTTCNLTGQRGCDTIVQGDIAFSWGAPRSKKSVLATGKISLSFRFEMAQFFQHCCRGWKIVEIYWKAGSWMSPQVFHSSRCLIFYSGSPNIFELCSQEMINLLILNAFLARVRAYGIVMFIFVCLSACDTLTDEPNRIYQNLKMFSPEKPNIFIHISF